LQFSVKASKQMAGAKRAKDCNSNAIELYDERHYDAKVQKANSTDDDSL
jgi:hypothetical protein